MLSKLSNYGKACDIPIVANSPGVEIRSLIHSYTHLDIPVLDNIDLTIDPGERVALVGPNGAGKTTLIKLIAGLEKIQSGSIHVYGNAAHQCKHRVALVPQRSDIDWRFPITVYDAVMMGRYVHLGWGKRPRARDVQAVEHAMQLMEIQHLADRRVGDLSGGQQQRAMLARTLAHDADLLLLDEPLNHVDVATQEIIFHTLEDLCEQNKTVIVSTHDLGILPTHFSRALFLDKQIIADGPVGEVLTAETIARAYGFEFHG
ncbi:MAG: metal ABC transporter ATP-binding protein [Anaerolineae bacterium]|nr:metal ABC transporter ATP-binding protein [Anaerolineae bacterium]